MSQAYHLDHQTQHGELYTVFTHAFSWADISDHKGGVLLLCANLLACAGARWVARRAAAQAEAAPAAAGGGGGATKRLRALTEAAGAAALAPWAVYHWRDLVSWELGLNSYLCFAHPLD